MSYLQRAPIDVYTNNGCNIVPSAVDYATERLLNASTGLFPFAGAIIRHAYNPQQEPALDKSNADQVGVIKRVNEVAGNWWASRPESQDYDFVPLAFSHPARTDSLGHYDQYIYEMPDATHLDDGPLSALLVSEGSVEYQLAVFRANLLTVAGQRTFADKAQNDSLPKGRIHKVAAHAGDLLLITNLPPTHHTARQLTENRRSQVYFSGFTPVEAVE